MVRNNEFIRMLPNKISIYRLIFLYFLNCLDRLGTYVRRRVVVQPFRPTRYIGIQDFNSTSDARY